MGLENGYFGNNLNSFSNNTALVDAETNKSISYLELEIESQALAEKLKLSVEGLIFLLKTNNSESVITYITSLKSNNAVLLLDEKLNDVIRNSLLGDKDGEEFFYVTVRMKRFINIFGLRTDLDEVQKMVENHFDISIACTGKDELLKILVHSEDHLTTAKEK